MGRVITVMVTDTNGYGVSNQCVYTYQNSENKQYSNSDGECTVILSTEYEDEIYVNGSRKWSGSASSCKNPLVIVKS